jgi:hypothetical protein
VGGTYQVIVTEAKWICTAIATTNVTVKPLTATAASDLTCNGGTNQIDCHRKWNI